MKKRLFVIILICALLCLVLCACNAPADNAPDKDKVDAPSDSTTQDAESNEKEECVAKPILGVWWWSKTLGDEYLDFAAENGVTEIYFCSAEFNKNTDSFIEKANAKGMDVYWLAGEYQWVEDNSGLLSQMVKYESYQASYSHKFKGVHLDIEPHQHSEFKSRRNELLTKFASLAYDLRSRYPELWIEYDIPFWMEDEVTINGVTKPCFQHVMDNASRVSMMSYRDTAEKIYSVSEAEINYALQTGKTLNLGVNTKSSEGDQVSFQEEGKQRMYAEIARLREMIPQNFGVVIHQIKYWYELKD